MKKHALASLIALSLSSTAFAQDDEVKPFTMEGELGFISTTGNTDTTSINAGITASQELENWSNDYAIEGLYRQETVEGDDGEDEDVTSAQKFFASAQGNYKLENPDNRLFVFASYEDDRFSNFNYQSTIAAGWNQKVIETNNHTLEYSIGPGYSFVETQEDESQNSVIVRASTIYSWKISDTAKFTQTASTEVGEENTKSRAESALTATISGNLSMRLSFKLDHNSQVAEGVEKLDTETAVSLVYNFF
jgi:putative salt-induced outer membrane protein YdiY